jgi:hypothetical protein
MFLVPKPVCPKVRKIEAQKYGKWIGIQKKIGKSEVRKSER